MSPTTSHPSCPTPRISDTLTPFSSQASDTRHHASQGLVGILTLRLRACTWGPRPSANHDYPSQSPSKAQAAESPRTSAKHDSPRTAVKTDSPRPAGKSESVKGMGAGAGGAGPGSASESAAEIRNTNYEAGLKLLGLAIGGWMLVLPGWLCVGVFLGPK